MKFCNQGKAIIQYKTSIPARLTKNNFQPKIKTMGLAEKYSKAIIKKFDQIPVYVPGAGVVSPGDIISFGTNIMGNAKAPLGNFTTHGNIGTSFDIQYNLHSSAYLKQINYVSGKSVSIGAAVKGEYPNVIEGDIKFKFESENTFLIYGRNSVETRIADLFKVENQLLAHKDKESWSKYYIVTAVVICEKALIYAAETKGGELIVSVKGNIGIGETELINIEAEVDFSIKKVHNAAFHTDWEDNVVVLMKLAQFKKNDLVGYNKMAGATDTTTYKLTDTNPTYILQELNKGDIL